MKHKLIGACSIAILSLIVVAPCKSQTPKARVPAFWPQQHYIPVTVVINHKALQNKAGLNLNGIQLPPLPRRPGRLLDRLRQKQPLQKLLGALDANKEALAQLKHISEPVPLGNELWLSMNIQEICVRGVDVQLGADRTIVALAVRNHPLVVLSKVKPPPMPLPDISIGKVIPAPPLAGTPINVIIAIDPKALPGVLPPDAHKELAKYGIDCTKAVIEPKNSFKGNRLTVAVPMEKPLRATLQVAFTPRVDDNVLSFIDPECSVTPVDSNDKNSVTQALQKFTQNAVRTVVVAKMKTQRVDFRPHLKQLDKLQFGNAKKVQARMGSFRVVDMGAVNNHLVVNMAGLVGREGIVIQAP